MKTEIHLNPPAITIDEFADKHDLTMEVRERSKPPNPNDRFYAAFKRFGVRRYTATWVGLVGNGASPEEAIRDYARQISGISIYELSSHPREIFVGNLKP